MPTMTDLCDSVTLVTGGLEVPASHRLAFNAGVNAALAQAREVAAAISSSPNFKPTRHGFAVEALNGFADEGRALLVSAEPAPASKVVGSAVDRCQA